MKLDINNSIQLLQKEQQTIELAAIQQLYQQLHLAKHTDYNIFVNTETHSNFFIYLINQCLIFRTLHVRMKCSTIFLSKALDARFNAQ